MCVVRFLLLAWCVLMVLGVVVWIWSPAPTPVVLEGEPELDATRRARRQRPLVTEGLVR